jgi:hypothetical protein
VDNGGNYNDDNDWTFSRRLPAVIPLHRVPVVIPLTRRFTIPFWGLILVTMSGSVLAGAVAATLWPWDYHNKTSGAVATRPYGDDAVNAGNIDDSTLVATEVTKIDLSPASLNTTNLNTSNLNTSNLNTSNLNTSNLNTSNLNTANLSTTNLNTTEIGISRPAAAEPVTVAPIPITAPVPVQPAAAEPSFQGARDLCNRKSSGPLLVLNLNRTVLHSDQPASLGLTIDNAPDGAHLLICGYAAQSVFSVGRAVDENTWTVPASRISDAIIIPPHGFAGPMDIAIMLVNTDRSLVDRKVLHLQWLPQARPVPQMETPPRDFAKNDSLLSYGAHLKAVGNLADARQIFSRVAQTGDPRGAFVLAETYDPISLAKHQLLPKDSDLEMARIWYRKATDLGSSDAPSRLDRLTNW